MDIDRFFLLFGLLFFGQVTWIQLVPQILHHAATAAVVVTGGRAAVRHIAGPGARTFQSENLGGDSTLKENHRKPIGKVGDDHG